MSGAAGATYGVDVIARVLNLTPRRVQQLAKEGVIPKAARGQYALAPTVTAYVKYLQELIKNPGGEDKSTYQLERTRLTKANADIAEIEVRKLNRELVESDEIASAWAHVASEIRSNLLNAVPSRIAAGAKGLKSEAKLKALIKTEIAAALGALSSLDADAVLGGTDG